MTLLANFFYLSRTNILFYFNFVFTLLTTGYFLFTFHNNYSVYISSLIWMLEKVCKGTEGVIWVMVKNLKQVVMWYGEISNIGVIISSLSFVKKLPPLCFDGHKPQPKSFLQK